MEGWVQRHKEKDMNREMKSVTRRERHKEIYTKRETQRQRHKEKGRGRRGGKGRERHKERKDTDVNAQKLQENSAQGSL